MQESHANNGLGAFEPSLRSVNSVIDSQSLASGRGAGPKGGATEAAKRPPPAPVPSSGQDPGRGGGGEGASGWVDKIEDDGLPPPHFPDSFAKKAPQVAQEADLGGFNKSDSYAKNAPQGPAREADPGGFNQSSSFARLASAKGDLTTAAVVAGQGQGGSLRGQGGGWRVGTIIGCIASMGTSLGVSGGPARLDRMM